MTRPLRLLFTSPPSSSHPPTPPPPPPPALEQLNSDFVVILAALLCALICFLGLVAVARCAWLRRFANQHNPPPLPAAANKGLKKKVLRSLPTQPYSPHFEQADCAICLAEFAEGDQLRVLPQCGHGFHVACIDTWLGSHSSCPSCRQILVVERCRKCGGVPPESGASGSSEVRRKESEDGEAQLPQYLP